MALAKGGVILVEDLEEVGEAGEVEKEGGAVEDGGISSDVSGVSFFLIDVLIQSTEKKLKKNRKKRIQKKDW